jgi:hypothetical protein
VCHRHALSRAQALCQQARVGFEIVPALVDHLGGPVPRGRYRALRLHDFAGYRAAIWTPALSLTSSKQGYGRRAADVKP